MSIDITKIMNHLHINDTNDAFSTGSTWGSSADAVVKDIFSPTDGKKIASAKFATESDYNHVVETAAKAFKTWRTIPAQSAARSSGR